MSLFSCLVAHISDSSSWVLLTNPRRRKNVSSPVKIRAALSKVGAWTQNSIRYKDRASELQVLGGVDKSVTPGWHRGTIATSNSALNSVLPNGSSLCAGSTAQLPVRESEKFTTSFLKRLQNKQSKHQSVSAGCTLACLEEGNARDSFWRPLAHSPALLGNRQLPTTWILLSWHR